MNRMNIPLEALEAYGESTGRTLPVGGSVKGTQVEQQLRRALKFLRRQRDSFQTRYTAPAMPESARWLLDNYYLAQREGLDSCAAFHRAGRLPAADGEALILALCRGLLTSGGGSAEEARCRLFLSGFQKKTVLNHKELGLFIPALRTAAILQLAALYEQDTPPGEAVAALFGTLRLWSVLDAAPLLETIDQTEQILRQDPAEIYPRMDEGSRSAYRRRVQQLARRRGIPEHRAAQRAIRLAKEGSDERTRHVGYYLYLRPLGDNPRRAGGIGYITLLTLLPLGLSLAAGYALDSPGAAALLWLPVWQAVKTLTDTLLHRFTRPRHLPRLALEEGVPETGRTICVISTLLTGAEEATAMTRRLEEFYHASRACGGALLFGLLCDLPENEQLQTQAERRLLQQAAEAVETLNRRYGGGFYLLFRERSWSRDTGCFTGWERKRGALLELARLLKGEKSTLQILAGEPRRLKGTRYILTLDADTRLLPDSARELIGAAMHPLNKPVIDRTKRLVVAGHGVIQPRIATELPAAGGSLFTRLFAPQGGTDPYGSDTGEVYMDRFESGGFAGKGILDVQAFLFCMDKRLPESRVLSHDALEGAFLRGGLMADTELTDRFPDGVLSYYKRQHRWIRGDWQNLPWLFRAGKDLPPVEKWRLFDSLRRSLTPLGTLAALLAGFLLPGKAMAWTAALTLICYGIPLFLSLLRMALQPEELAHLRLLSGVYHGASAALMKTLLELVLLPYEAWISLSAAATALWRMFLSRKNLLQWQTAAQAAEAADKRITTHYRRMWPSVLTAALCLLLSVGIPGRAMGVLWLLSPAAAAGLCRPRSSGAPLSPTDRDWLKGQAGAIWRYYRDFCTKEDHYLPPDNFQDSPPVGPAHRTSPTNIGLGLLSALCAMDLGLASREEALALMDKMLLTIEQLPKWNGHLYNWYDTRTAQPLEPKYVSTVDSGNLAGCLLTLREGLTEYNITETANRAEALRSAMDFRPLYDESRHLFRIGLEPDSPAEAKSWYDLLESEERLTGYLTIATGQVPRRHWRRLSRAQVGCDGFRGMASWTGTMFEYLMPELFLPLYRDSLLYESARFALYVQRKRRAGPLKLWGCSESAFYALDAGLNYRYKAHGCPRLALCRDMDREQVISPYSSFLALKLSPRGALENLRAMETMGMSGPYGFWEAVDFTPSRCEETGSIVRCVMAHHLGMSLAAIANALLEDILPRRFMADPAMAAYAPLLQEKVPLGGLLLQRREKNAPPPRRFEAGSPRQKEGCHIDWANPVCTALSNGVYSLLITESGLSQSRCAGILPYKSPRLPLGDGQGLELWWQQGEETLSLLPSPRQNSSFSWRLTGGEALHTGCGDGGNWSVKSRISGQTAGELRQIELHREEPRQEGRLFLRFEPVLTPERDYRSQPSFARLGLETRWQDGMLLIRRLPRGGQKSLHMAVACSEEAVFSCDSAAGGRGSLPGPVTPDSGWQSACCVTAQVTLPPGQETLQVSFALCLAASGEDACRGAARMLTEPAGFDMARAAAGTLGLSEESADAALDMLPALVFPHISQEGESLPGIPRNELWALGISGDHPIVAVEYTGEEAIAPAEEQLRRHGLLSACGIPYDLVFLTDDGGEYLQPRRSALESALRHMGRETAIGVPGGVHFAPLEKRTLFRSAASLYGSEVPQPRQPRQQPQLPPPMNTGDNPPDFAWDDRGGFTATLKGSLPPRCWGNVLTNGHLSYFAADAGTGAMWLDNARECRLTPWTGDPLAEAGPERLWVRQGQEIIPLFARNGGDCRLYFAPGSTTWEVRHRELTLRLTACIPPENNVRIFLLESSAPCKVHWCAPLQLAAETEDALSCTTLLEEGIFTARNPRCSPADLQFQAGCSQPWLETATDIGRYLAGECRRPHRCGEPGFAGSFWLEGEAVLVCGTEDVKPWLDPRRARQALDTTGKWWQNKIFALTAETPEPELNRLLQGWAAYQALACRVMARSSPYQSGGALGFRDQLQDRVNLIPLDAPGCRAHILLSCAHQFREGDVQHWWHPTPGKGADKGVRTRCSDDLLWLPWALCEYVEQTGDESLCAETAPWLSSAPLSPEEDSRYETPELFPERSSVLAHCRRALELVLVRGAGQHGLLFMGSGDWNDGFDAMGKGAESVWLSWFFSLVAHAFAKLLNRLGEPDGDKYEMAARALGQSADRAWEEDRYLRGYYGDGTPLGSGTQPACCIDSIAQSFAAFCPYADPDKVDRALDTALNALWDREDKLVRLYTPAFTGEERAPGYVSGYGPGFRENGGQYTHAALWLAMACFRRNRPEEGAALLGCACPGGRDTEKYGAEPFVIPADIYAGDQQGRAGWSWYTGSAGWLFSVAFRELLGFRLRDGKPQLQPCLPPHWSGFSGRWTDPEGKTHEFGFRNGESYCH